MRRYLLYVPLDYNTEAYIFYPLPRVARVVKILGMINAVPDFETHNKVLDGASDLFYEAFGPDIGCHGRSSVGIAGLVANQPVEIEGIFLIHDE